VYFSRDKARYARRRVPSCPRNRPSQRLRARGSASRQRRTRRHVAKRRVLRPTRCGRSVHLLSLITFGGGDPVASLIVRDVDASLVLTLKQRAAKHGRSAEAEHREILASALRRPRKRHLADVLAAIPNVGRDEDFARVEDVAEAQRVPR